MSKSSIAFALALTVAAAVKPSHAAFDGDLVPHLIGNTIAIDGISDEDGSVASNISVFQYTLGELTPGFTSDPGLQPESGSNLPANSFLGFNVAGPLLYWDGIGATALSPAPANTQFQLYLGNSHVEITGNTSASSGFIVAQLNDQGATHRHLNAQVLGAPSPNGNYSDALGNTYTPPPDGIYAFPIKFTDASSQTTGPAQYTSVATWLVYNQNLSDQQLTTAADAIQLAIQGDADLSGTVDLLDFDAWFNHVGERTALFSQGDFDSSGIVDLRDFDIWFNHVGLTTQNILPVSAVPEPASVAILAPAIALLLLARKNPRGSLFC